MMAWIPLFLRHLARVGPPMPAPIMCIVLTGLITTSIELCLGEFIECNI
jgi:hypothetical protein